MAKRLSKYFGLNKSQSECDFVDVDLVGDMPLFIDPHALSKRQDQWSVEASNLIVDFFQQAIDLIRHGDEDGAKEILSNLGEPNETGLGLSKKGRRGRGVAGRQSLDLYEYLKDSTAAKTGFLKDLEDCELLVPGISSDKISDITTNIIRAKLVEYTKDQCDLLGIPTQNMPAGKFWDPHMHSWAPEDYAELPIYKSQRLLLAPKAIVRQRMAFDHQEYYNHDVLQFLQAYHLNAGSALVELLRNGKRRVTKKSLKELNPLSKGFLYQFSKEHPDVFEKYKGRSRDLREIEDSAIEATPLATANNLNSILTKLKAIPSGTKDAPAYHAAMVGILEALFYPALIYPRKEQALHDGRKRIDITYSNAANSGFFQWLHAVQKVPCSFIMIECKNYSADPQNPELDQISGRFSVQRGQLGLLVCRTCSNRQLFVKRCRDTAKDGRGFVLLLTDKDIEQLLGFKIAGDEQKLNEWLDGQFRALVF